MLPRDRALAVSLAALAISVARPLPASAQPAPPPEQPAPAPAPAPAAPPSAQELRDKARAELTAGNVAGACLLFEQSYQAAKAPGSNVPPDDALFDLASCHEKQGKGSIASAEFTQIAAA